MVRYSESVLHFTLLESSAPWSGVVVVDVFIVAMSGSDFLLLFIQTIVCVWDFITYPIYQALQRPWERRKAMNRIRAKVVRSSAEEIVYESPEIQCAADRDLTRAKVDTMDKAWSWAVRRYGPRPLLGTRDIMAEEDEVQSNGKIFKKLELGDYRYSSKCGQITSVILLCNSVGGFRTRRQTTLLTSLARECEHWDSILEKR